MLRGTQFGKLCFTLSMGVISLVFVIVLCGGNVFRFPYGRTCSKALYIFKGIRCSLLQISVSSTDKTNNSDGLVQQHAQACRSYERFVSQRDGSESASTGTWLLERYLENRDLILDTCGAFAEGFSLLGLEIVQFVNPQATNVIYIYMEHPFLMFLDHTQ